MDRQRDLVLITGATGKQGGAVARQLLLAGARVRAMTRKPDSEPARALAARGAEVVRGDLDDPASVERALEGVWGTFAVQNTWEAGVEKEEEQGKRFAELARRRNVQHFVYASVGSAHRKTGIPHFDNKGRIEETVRRLRFPSHVILRPVFFMENFLGPSFADGIRRGQLVIALAPTTKLQMIAVEDIGKIGRQAFLDHARLAGREIDLAGDELTMPEAARVLSAGLGRPVEFERQPIEQVRAFSEDFALMLEWFDRVGYEADIAGLEQEFGLELIRFPGWVEAHREALR
jgi:uncharacterized protein YbjT (DUF2867 family)